MTSQACYQVSHHRDAGNILPESGKTPPHTQCLFLVVSKHIAQSRWLMCSVIFGLEIGLRGLVLVPRALKNVRREGIRRKQEMGMLQILASEAQAKRCCSWP